MEHNNSLITIGKRIDKYKGNIDKLIENVNGKYLMSFRDAYSLDVLHRFEQCYETFYVNDIKYNEEFNRIELTVTRLRKNLGLVILKTKPEYISFGMNHFIEDFFTYDVLYIHKKIREYNMNAKNNYMREYMRVINGLIKFDNDIREKENNNYL